MPEHTNKELLEAEYKRIAGVLNSFRSTFRAQLKPSPDVFSVFNLPEEAFTPEDLEKLRALVAPDPPPLEVQERFELNNDYTVADAKQWVTELAYKAIVFLRDVEGVPLPATGDTEGWENLLALMATPIAENLLQSRAPGELMRGDVSELGDPFYNASIQTVLVAEYEAKRLPTHLLEGQKIDAILEEQHRAGRISDSVWNAYRRSVIRVPERGAIREEIAGEPLARAFVLQNTVVRMLEETRQNLPATTQAALASTGSTYGHFGFAIGNVIKSETPEILASGESLFSYEVQPGKLRAEARREIDLARFGEGQPDLTKAFQEAFTGPDQLVDPSFITDPTKSKAQANVIARVGAILKEHQKNIIAANPRISQEDLQRLMGEAAESLLEDALSSIPDEEARLRLEAISTSDGLNKARGQLLFNLGVDPASIGDAGKAFFDRYLREAGGDIDLASTNARSENISDTVRDFQTAKRQQDLIEGRSTEDTILEGLRISGLIDEDTIPEQIKLLKKEAIPKLTDDLNRELNARYLAGTDPGDPANIVAALTRGQGITPLGQIADLPEVRFPTIATGELARTRAQLENQLRFSLGGDDRFESGREVIRGDIANINAQLEELGLGAFRQSAFPGRMEGDPDPQRMITPDIPETLIDLGAIERLGGEDVLTGAFARRGMGVGAFGVGQLDPGAIGPILAGQLSRTAYQRPDVTSEVMPALQALAGESRGFETYLGQQAPDLLRLFREGGAGGGIDAAKVRRLFGGYMADRSGIQKELEWVSEGLPRGVPGSLRDRAIERHAKGLEGQMRVTDEPIELMRALVGTSQRPQVSFGDFLGSQEERLRKAFGATPTGIAEVKRETQQTELERRRRLRRPGRTALVSALA